MFEKIKQALSINDVLFTRKSDEQRRPRGIAKSIVHIGNPHNVNHLNATTSQPQSKPYQGAHIVNQNSLVAPSASCSNSTLAATHFDPVSHSDSTPTSAMGNVMFTNLMESTDLQDSQKNLFFHMNMMDLIKEARTLNNHPSFSEFKMVLFNDSFRICRVDLKQNVVFEIRNALSQGTGMSYQFLGNMAISVSQCVAATNILRQEHIISMSEFNNISLRLHCHMNELSRIGNTYYNYVNAGSNPDSGLYHLVARPALNKNGQKLYKECEILHKNVKLMITKDHVTAINQNLNTLVNQFIYNYFQLSKQPEQGQSIQLKDYICPNELKQIQALFKDTSRVDKGHQINAGGAQHVYECYAELFNHFIPRHQIILQ